MAASPPAGQPRRADAQSLRPLPGLPRSLCAARRPADRPDPYRQPPALLQPPAGQPRFPPAAAPARRARGYLSAPGLGTCPAPDHRPVQRAEHGRRRQPRHTLRPAAPGHGHAGALQPGAPQPPIRSALAALLGALTFTASFFRQVCPRTPLNYLLGIEVGLISLLCVALLVATSLQFNRS